MSVKKMKIVLSLLVVGLLVFKAETSARPLRDDEGTRLYGSIKAQSFVDMIIDVSFMRQIVTRPEVVSKIKQETMDETKRLRKELNDDSITLESLGIALPDGSEIHLSEKRIRIGNGLKMRVDTTIFANEEMTETNYEATTINSLFSLFDMNAPSYQIDHKLKRAFINNARWSGREVLRFGKVDEDILMDIVMLCSPKRDTSISKNKHFSYKGTGNVDGKVVNEIECIDLNGNVKYAIFLDSHDWRVCRKIVRYNKSGLISKVVEYKEFAKAKGNGELFPHLVIRQHFDREGKEEKVEVISITNVMIGLPVTEDIFKLDVPPDYTIVDNLRSTVDKPPH